MNFVPIDSAASAALPIKDDLRLQARRRPPADSAAVRRPPPRRATAPQPIPVEIAFLSSHGVPEQVLRFAAATARRQGVCADEALLAEGLVAEDVFYRALAQHLDVDYIDDPVDVCASGVATVECGYARIRDASRNYLWLFAPSGAGVFRLMSVRRAAKGRALFAITTRTRFLEALRRADPDGAARNAAFLAERVDRELCARGGLQRGQVGLLLLALIALVASLYAPFYPLRLASAFLLAAMFFCGAFLRLFACAASIQPSAEPEALEGDARLPIYTIVLALYQEAAVVRQLTRAIAPSST
ncbi:MAG: hypothetical protein ACR65U_09430 [Methylocystis sp.]